MKRILSASLCAFAFLTSCGDSTPQEPVIGEAFVGPGRLPVREQLSARAALVATLIHGERLEIVGRRRRFVKIRTAAGKVGWVDSRLLLSSADMQDLRTLAGRAAKAPSQGKAAAFDLLNAHTAPNRQAPSYFQIASDDRVDVIAHMRAPRIAFDYPTFDDGAPARPAARKKKKPPAVPPPPAGPPPAVPRDWLDLSQPRFATPSAASSVSSNDASAAQPAPTDDWTLVRDGKGRAGWVLTRMLHMLIPDEVAQYAERARITAYFELGSVKDRTLVKPTWLWTTLVRGGVDHHFDSVRVFTWSARRHRYETSYIERNLTGWGPVLLHDSGPGQPRGFSLLVREKDGSIARRFYGLQGTRFRLLRRQPEALPDPWYTPSSGPAAHPQSRDGSDSPQPPLTQRVTGWLKELRSRFSR
jgi:hypothetical protein